MYSDDHACNVVSLLGKKTTGYSIWHSLWKIRDCGNSSCRASASRRSGGSWYRSWWAAERSREEAVRKNGAGNLVGLECWVRRGSGGGKQEGSRAAEEKGGIKTSISLLLSSLSFFSSLSLSSLSLSSLYHSPLSPSPLFWNCVDSYCTAVWGLGWEGWWLGQRIWRRIYIRHACAVDIFIKIQLLQTFEKIYCGGL